MLLNSIYYAFLQRFKYWKRKDFLYYFIIIQEIYWLKKKNNKKVTLIEVPMKNKGKSVRRSKKTVYKNRKKKRKKKKKNIQNKWILIKKGDKRVKKKKTVKKIKFKRKKKINKCFNFKLNVKRNLKQKRFLTRRKYHIKNDKKIKLIIMIFYIIWTLKKIKKIKLSPYTILLSSLDNLKPVLVLKGRLIRGRLNKIPFIIKRNSDYKQVFNWLRENWNEKKKKENYFTIHIVKEISVMYNTVSKLFKNREILYEEVLQNRSSIRFLKKKKKRN